jgi:hypothetical protein
MLAPSRQIYCVDAGTLEGAQLDDLSRKIWQAHTAETVPDAEAQGLSETLHTPGTRSARP